MEFHQIFNFFTLLQQSIQIFKKNVKLMATITIISLILTSISILLFFNSSQFLLEQILTSLMAPTSDSNNSSSPIIMFMYFLLVLVIYIAFFFAILVVSMYSDRATILVSSMSYKSEESLSLKELYSKVKSQSTIKRPVVGNRVHLSCKSLPFLVLVIVVTNLIIIYPNWITISIGIVFGVIGFVYIVYKSVVWALAFVVSMLEEDCYKEKAIERAEELVKGRMLDGFMLNLFMSLLFSVIFLIYWMVVFREGIGANIAMLMVFVLNISLVQKILMLVAYTVFYYECKRHTNEGNGVEYTKISSTEVLDDAIV